MDLGTSWVSISRFTPNIARAINRGELKEVQLFFQVPNATIILTKPITIDGKEID